MLIIIIFLCNFFIQVALKKNTLIVDLLKKECIQDSTTYASQG